MPTYIPFSVTGRCDILNVSISDNAREQEYSVVTLGIDESIISSAVNLNNFWDGKGKKSFCRRRKILRLYN